jgi:hypothetical protein
MAEWKYSHIRAAEQSIIFDLFHYEASYFVDLVLAWLFSLRAVPFAKAQYFF